MVPLLAIAFIVAAISTGVFYGLFAGRLRASADLPPHGVVVAARDLGRGTVLKPADLKLTDLRGKAAPEGAFSAPQKLVGATVLQPLKENEPFTDAGVASGDNAPAAAGIAPGMRAVSIHVYESSGVLNLLRRGSRVDIQAFSERNNTFELATVLQNIEVLGVTLQAEPVLGGRGAAPVVTVLTLPSEADILALADSGTHLRLALRNPLDKTTEPRKSLAVPALFRASDVPVRRAAADAPRPSAEGR